jgi:membrane carboxypeptidase/penicillin-binding protein PbpC
MMMDVRTAFLTKEGDPYVPQNYDRLWHGPVLLRQSLASSFNLVAVKVLDYVGLDSMTDLARQLGITTFDNSQRFGLSLTLGGGEVRLLELTAAYAAFANGGYKVEPTTILKVTDAGGETLWQTKPTRLNRVLTPQATYLITDILSDNFARAAAFSEGSPLRLTRPAAAKTGTTTDFRDNWTIGYTPDFVTGVWAGNADNEPMRHVSGITGAAPIWHDVMEAIHKNRPVHHFARPDGLNLVTVCSANGLLPSEGCHRTLDEIFVAGTEPRQTDNWYQLATIDRRNGLLAGPDCPPEQTINRWFIRYPAEAEPWIEQYHITHLPGDYSPLCPPADNRLALADTDPTRSAADILTQRLAATPIFLISPDQGTAYRISPDIPLDKQRIRVAVQVTTGIKPGSVQLLVDGQPLAHGTEALWQLSLGLHRFEATALDLNDQPVRTDAVEIEVRTH